MSDALQISFLLFASYEERLNCLVLKEELFPLMAEIKEFLCTLTAAGRGIVGFPRLIMHKTHNRVRAVKLFDFAVNAICLLLELLECDNLHSVIRLVLKTGNYMNAVSV